MAIKSKYHIAKNGSEKTLVVKCTSYSEIIEAIKEAPTVVTNITMELDNDRFLSTFPPAWMPSQIKSIDIYFHYDAHTHSKSALQKLQERVEKFAIQFPSINFKFRCDIPYDTSLAYTRSQGWSSNYDP